MKQFFIGDRVVYNKLTSGMRGPNKGNIGTVKYVRDYDDGYTDLDEVVLVEYDEEIPSGHDAGGCRYGHGWYTKPRELDLIDDNISDIDFNMVMRVISS